MRETIATGGAGREMRWPLVVLAAGEEPPQGAARRGIAVVASAVGGEGDRKGRRGGEMR